MALTWKIGRAEVGEWGRSARGEDGGHRSRCGREVLAPRIFNDIEEEIAMEDSAVMFSRILIQLV